jgi:hypothetical protein
MSRHRYEAWYGEPGSDAPWQADEFDARDDAAALTRALRDQDETVTLMCLYAIRKVDPGDDQPWVIAERAENARIARIVGERKDSPSIPADEFLADVERLLDANSDAVQEGSEQAARGEGRPLHELHDHRPEDRARPGSEIVDLLHKLTPNNIDHSCEDFAKAEGQYPDPLQARMVPPETHIFMVARYPTDWVLVRAHDAQHAADLANEDERRRGEFDPDLARPFRADDAGRLPRPDGEPGVFE